MLRLLSRVGFIWDPYSVSCSDRLLIGSTNSSNSSLSTDDSVSVTKFRSH